MLSRILALTLITLLLSGCPLEGDDGIAGLNGIDCWDINENRENDIDEDINKDGVWTAADISDTTTAKLAPHNQDV